MAREKKRWSYSHSKNENLLIYSLTALLCYMHLLSLARVLEGYNLMSSTSACALTDLGRISHLYDTGWLVDGISTLEITPAIMGHSPRQCTVKLRFWEDWTAVLIFRRQYIEGSKCRRNNDPNAVHRKVLSGAYTSMCVNQLFHRSQIFRSLTAVQIQRHFLAMAPRCLPAWLKISLGGMFEGFGRHFRPRLYTYSSHKYMGNFKRLSDVGIY